MKISVIEKPSARLRVAISSHFDLVLDNKNSHCIEKILKGDKTLKGKDKQNYYKGIKVAMDENFQDDKVKQFINKKIHKGGII